MRFWPLQIDLWPAGLVLLAAAFAVGALFVIDRFARADARRRTRRALRRDRNGSSAE